MLSFAVYSSGQPATNVNLAGAYVLGSDDVPLRAEIAFLDGVIQCTKRAAGPAGLALLWKIEGAGTILTETVRLQERKEPYILQVELTRGRLMRISQRIEDWGLLDFPGVDAILAEVAAARELLIKALQADIPAEAADWGEKALSAAVRSSESLTRFHADALLARRKQSGGMPRRLLGCGLHLDKPVDAARQRLTSACDFATVPMRWRDIEPTEQIFHWKPLDAWVETLAKNRFPIKGSSLLSFNERAVPDWLYIWEHDFDAIRDLAFEHVRRVINRYGQYVHSWDVISGIHANNCFTFNFEQLMELTRMAAALTKQTFPRSVAIIDIIAPWGEYYSRNQRTIPPLLYADMVVQSGVTFDGFGLKFLFGPAIDGMFVRDMFQISTMLDLYGKLGKPLHITAVQVPSGVGHDSARPLDGGSWHEPWSEPLQSQWLREFLVIAASKPFVESVSWHNLADHADQLIAHGGLLRSDLVPKAGYNELLKLHSELTGTTRRPERQSAAG